MRIHSFYPLGPDLDSPEAKSKEMLRPWENIRIPDGTDPRVAIAIAGAIACAKVWVNFWNSRGMSRKYLWRCEYCLDERVATNVQIGLMPKEEARCKSGRRVGLCERLGCGLFDPRFDCRSAFERKDWPKWILDFQKGAVR